MKSLRYFIEAQFMRLMMLIFRSMSPMGASDLGGWIGRKVGLKLAASRKAKRNYSLAFPDASKDQVDDVVVGMWDNLGRVMAEYSHLTALGTDFYTEVIGEDILEQVKESGQGAVFFGGHLANWEIPSSSCYQQFLMDLCGVYRAPNNPRVHEMLADARNFSPTIQAFAKSSSGTRALVKHLRDGGYAGIVFDQKYNKGVEAQFFNRTAMTSTAPIDLAQKFKLPLIPIRTERLENCRFRVTYFEPIELFDEKGQKRDVMDVLNDMHAYLERWIEERPEQWLWLHRRWKD